VIPQKQANPQKAFERPTLKKLHPKLRWCSHDLIYEQPPFSRTDRKRRPFFGKPASEKQNDSHAPRGHCPKNLEQNQSRTDTTGERGKKRLNPENTLTLHPKRTNKTGRRNRLK